jgi:sulfite exporter TauE/SafE
MMLQIFPNAFTAVNAALKKRFAKHLKHQSLSSLFIVGMINGLLPCGFVYLVLAGSVAGGAAYMALFGLGTIPAMLAVSLTGHFFGMRSRNYFRKATPLLPSPFPYCSFTAASFCMKTKRPVVIIPKRLL